MALTMSVPVLGVKDVEASAAFVRDRLGFELLGTWGEPTCFAILSRDGVELFLQTDASADRAPDSWSVYLRCHDADALHDEMKGRGAPIASGLRDAPYGCREFAVAGPEHHTIAFGGNLD